MPSNVPRVDLATEQTASEVRVSSSFEKELRDKICVRSPYFQLTDLQPFGEAGVRAYVLFESPRGIESDALASAEVGRHLAILGSCALAHNNPKPGRHYYLATEALLLRHPTPSLDVSEPVMVSARPDGPDHAVVELATQRGELSSTLRCKYQVLPERVFARLFKNHRLEGATSDRATRSPYATAVKLEPLRSDTASAASLLGAVTPAMCLGHFDEFPAMPVAILMDGLHRLACRHAAAEVHPHLRLVSAEVRAERLAFAGESVEFSVDLLERSASAARYRGRAARHGDPSTVFGAIDLVYELLESDSVLDAPKTSALKKLSHDWSF